MTAMGKRRFAPSIGSTLAALAGILACLSLAQWQLGRAEQKRVLFDGFASGDTPAVALPSSFAAVERYQRIQVVGAYDPSRQFLLDNMTEQGRPGFHVLTPLLLNNGRIIIVNRGWVPLGPTRGALPDMAVDPGPRTVTGRADVIPRPPIDLIAPPPIGWPRIVNFPRMEQLAGWLEREVHPQVILLDAHEPEGYVRRWLPPGMPPEKHFAYAVQWAALGATVLGAWVVMGLRREGASS